jgi:hypothetical protein
VVKLNLLFLDPLLNILTGSHFCYFPLSIDSNRIVADRFNTVAVLHLYERLRAGDGDKLSDVREQQSICLLLHKIIKNQLMKLSYLFIYSLSL